MLLPKALKILIEDLRNQFWVKTLISKSEVFIVGGCVRDTFLGKDSKDIDIIVEGLLPSEITSLLEPLGKIDIVGESFAVIKFKPHNHKGEPFDIAIPRTDTKTGEGHKGFKIETKGVGISQDLKRRDFTINSMAVNIKTSKLLDPFDGVDDVIDGIIRATDKNAFIEDPLRILRGIQFSCRFNFDIERETMMLMKKNSHLIKEIPGERIMEEFMKILNKNGNTLKVLSLIHQSDIDIALFGKKMIHYETGLINLDPISFFYTLGILGDVDPSDFVKTRLRGEFNLAKNVKVLDKILTEWWSLEEEDLKFMLSKSFSVAPDVMDTILLPEAIDEIVLQMRTGKIPISMKDVQVSGDDIIEMGAGKIKDKEIGKILDRVLRDALMNNFNWKDRKESLNHLTNIIYQ
jgi:tRNA nucleotidyltransferase/poly(A) polymerase